MKTIELKKLVKIYFIVLLFSGPLTNADVVDCNVVNFDGIGRISYQDLAIFAEHWLSNCDYINQWCDGTDLNLSGLTDFNDYLLFAQCWQGEEDLAFANPTLLRPVFARDSIAFSCENNVLTEVAPDQMRLDTVAVCNNSDGVLRSSETADKVPLNILCSNSSYIFAHNANTKKLYRSVDGDTWETVQLNFDIAGPTSAVFALANGRLLCWKPKTFLYRGIYKKWFGAWYSDDNGETWVQATDSSGNAYYFGGSPAPWSLYERLNGTICCTEYGSVTYYPGYINRSIDNGSTWSVVHSQAAGTIGHFHAIGYHEGTDKWICNTGDGKGKRFLLVSNDDGLSWSNYIDDKQDNSSQITRYLDYGHPTRILCSSDEYGMIHWLDLNDWSYEQLITNWDNAVNSAKSYLSYLIFKHGDVYYACQWDARASGYRNAVISVSTDLMHWVVYHRISDNLLSGAITFGGYKGGKLHLSISNVGQTVYKHLVISPAKVVMKKGMILCPPVTNIASDLTSSSSESLNGWNSQGTAPDIWEVTSAEKLHGNKSFHAKKIMPGGYLSVARTFPTEVGRWYAARVYLKTDCSYFNLRIGSQSTTDQATFFGGMNTWREYVSNIWQATSTSTMVSIPVFCREDNNVAEIYLDCLQFMEVPSSRWQVGGIPRAKEQCDYNVKLNNKWTHIFTVIPEVSSTRYSVLNDALNIRTYLFDDSNYVSIYWNPQESRFCLMPVGNGAGATITSDATEFTMEEMIRIIVRRDGAFLYLSVGNGQNVEHLPATKDHNNGSTGNLIIRSGDMDGNGLLPMTVVDDRLYNRWLTNGEIDNMLMDVKPSGRSDCADDYELVVY
jgi:hypothetical protein